MIRGAGQVCACATASPPNNDCTSAERPGPVLTKTETRIATVTSCEPAKSPDCGKKHEPASPIPPVNQKPSPSHGKVGLEPSAVRRLRHRRLSENLRPRARTRPGAETARSTSPVKVVILRAASRLLLGPLRLCPASRRHLAAPSLTAVAVRGEGPRAAVTSRLLLGLMSLARVSLTAEATKTSPSTQRTTDRRATGLLVQILIPSKRSPASQSLLAKADRTAAEAGTSPSIQRTKLRLAASLLVLLVLLVLAPAKTSPASQSHLARADQTAVAAGTSPSTQSMRSRRAASLLVPLALLVLLVLLFLLVLLVLGPSKTSPAVLKLLARATSTAVAIRTFLSRRRAATRLLLSPSQASPASPKHLARANLTAVAMRMSPSHQLPRSPRSAVAASKRPLSPSRPGPASPRNLARARPNAARARSFPSRPRLQSRQLPPPTYRGLLVGMESA